MNFESPLTWLVWITSFASIGLTYVISAFIIPDIGGDPTLWWKLSTIVSCGTLAGALIPELVKVFTSTESRHVREVVASAREGGASLDILSGFVSGNFSAYYLGLVMMVLMAIGSWVSLRGLGNIMLAAPVFAFGLVAFGFLGMGPVTIAVDSYGPVADNAQSVYELSLIETIPNVQAGNQEATSIWTSNFEQAKDMLEANDGAGNTFKATAKPVLIGTAVVGATTMIFATIMALTNGLTRTWTSSPCCMPRLSWGWSAAEPSSIGSPGLPRRPSPRAPTARWNSLKPTSSWRESRRPPSATARRSWKSARSMRRKGMLNIFIAVFFVTLAFAFLDPFFFIGYLISIADFRPLSGHLHGERGRGMGQCQEDCGGRAERKRDPPARCHRGRVIRWATRSRTPLRCL